MRLGFDEEKLNEWNREFKLKLSKKFNFVIK